MNGPYPKVVERSIATARDGSFAALGQLLDYYREFLLRIAAENLNSGLDPKYAPSDAVQDTFMQATAAFPRFKGTTEAELRAWLRQILINNLYDTARFYNAQCRDASLEVASQQELSPLDATRFVAQQPTPSEACRVSEEQVALHLALARLPDADRQAIEFRSMQGLSFAEIGLRLNKSADAARKQWSRAVERLACALSRGGGDG